MANNPDRCPTGLEIRGPMQPGYETVLTPAALEFVADLTRRFGDRVADLLAARAALQKRLDDGALPDFLPETADVRKAQWRVTPHSRRPAGSARRDHRPDRSQDGHQRAELGRESVHGGLRRLAHADLGQRRAGPDQPARCRRAARSPSANPDGKQYRLNPQIATLLVRPRGWHLYEKHVLRRRQAGARRVRRLRPVPVPQPRGAESARHGSVFLSAEAREPPRGAAVGRRVQALRSRRSASRRRRSRSRC